VTQCAILVDGLANQDAIERVTVNIGQPLQEGERLAVQRCLAKPEPRHRFAHEHRKPADRGAVSLAYAT